MPPTPKKEPPQAASSTLNQQVEPESVTTSSKPDNTVDLSKSLFDEFNRLTDLSSEKAGDYYTVYQAMKKIGLNGVTEKNRAMVNEGQRDLLKALFELRCKQAISDSDKHLFYLDFDKTLNFDVEIEPTIVGGARKADFHNYSAARWANELQEKASYYVSILTHKSSQTFRPEEIQSKRNGFVDFVQRFNINVFYSDEVDYKHAEVRDVVKEVFEPLLERLYCDGEYKVNLPAEVIKEIQEILDSNNYATIKEKQEDILDKITSASESERRVPDETEYKTLRAMFGGQGFKVTYSGEYDENIGKLMQKGVMLQRDLNKHPNCKTATLIDDQPRNLFVFAMQALKQGTVPFIMYQSRVAYMQYSIVAKEIYLSAQTKIQKELHQAFIAKDKKAFDAAMEKLEVFQKFSEEINSKQPSKHHLDIAFDMLIEFDLDITDIKRNLEQCQPEVFNSQEKQNFHYIESATNANANYSLIRGGWRNPFVSKEQKVAAFTRLQHLSDKGSSPASLALARLYRDGRTVTGGEKNKAKAADYANLAYQQAVALGNDAMIAEVKEWAVRNKVTLSKIQIEEPAVAASLTSSSTSSQVEQIEEPMVAASSSNGDQDEQALTDVETNLLATNEQGESVLVQAIKAGNKAHCDELTELFADELKRAYQNAVAKSQDKPSSQEFVIEFIRMVTNTQPKHHVEWGIMQEKFLSLAREFVIYSDESSYDQLVAFGLLGEEGQLRTACTGLLSTFGVKADGLFFSQRDEESYNLNAVTEEDRNLLTSLSAPIAASSSTSHIEQASSSSNSQGNANNYADLTSSKLPSDPPFEIKQGHFIEFKKESIAGYDETTRKIRTSMSKNWKIHVSVDPSDLSLAWHTVYPLLRKYGESFKIVNLDRAVKFIERSQQIIKSQKEKIAEYTEKLEGLHGVEHEEERKQLSRAINTMEENGKEILRDIEEAQRMIDGMQITLYMHPGEELRFKPVIDEIESSLRTAGVKPGIIYPSDKLLGQFVSYRHPGRKEYRKAVTVSSYNPEKRYDPFDSNAIYEFITQQEHQLEQTQALDSTHQAILSATFQLIQIGKQQIEQYEDTSEVIWDLTRGVTELAMAPKSDFGQDELFRLAKISTDSLMLHVIESQDPDEIVRVTELISNVVFQLYHQLPESYTASQPIGEVYKQMVRTEVTNPLSQKVQQYLSQAGSSENNDAAMRIVQVYKGLHQLGIQVTYQQQTIDAQPHLSDEFHVTSPISQSQLYEKVLTQQQSTTEYGSGVVTTPNIDSPTSTLNLIRQAYAQARTLATPATVDVIIQQLTELTGSKIEGLQRIREEFFIAKGAPLDPNNPILQHPVKLDKVGKYLRVILRLDESKLPLDNYEQLANSKQAATQKNQTSDETPVASSSALEKKEQHLAGSSVNNEKYDEDDLSKGYGPQ